MTVATRTQVVKNALASTSNVPSTCQLWTRTQYGAPSAGDQDHDGDADAVDGWNLEPTSARHTDRKPPKGVPVAWSGGSRGNGHRAISLGPDKDGVYWIRSTDAPVSGKVGTVPLSWPEDRWGLHYLGWSDTISGIPIVDDTKSTPPPKPKPLTAEDKARVIRRASRRARRAGRTKWADRLLAWSKNIGKRK